MTKVKNIHMSLTGIDESRAYSDSEVWSYYILPSTGFEFLDAQSREIMAKRIDTGYAALVGNKSKSVEIHLIVTSSPLNVESWALDWTSRAMERRWNVAPGFNNWVDECKEYLRTEDFAQKEIYLGVKLGSRSEYRDTGSGKGSSFFKTVVSSISSIGDVVAKYSGSSSQGVGSGEREYWEKKSRDVTRTLAGGNLKATPATASPTRRPQGWGSRPMPGRCPTGGSTPAPQPSTSCSEWWPRASGPACSGRSMTNRLWPRPSVFLPADDSWPRSRWDIRQPTTREGRPHDLDGRWAT